jgi:ABC-type transport system substrate-binding protein
MFQRALITYKITNLLFLLFLIRATISHAESVNYPEYGGIYNIPIPYSPNSLDPAIASFPVDRLILSQIYEGLVRIDKDDQIEPALADSWESADTGLTWQFHLKKNVRFHNGQPFDASAVEYSFKRLLSPELHSPKTWILDSLVGSREYITGQASVISGIKIIDPWTIQFQLKYPSPDFLDYLSSLPASIISPSTTGSVEQHPVGTGPFMFDLMENNQKITLKKNPDYWGGRPYLDSLNFIVYRQKETQMLEFELNHLQETPIAEADYRRISSDDRWKNLISKSNSPVFVYLGCNLIKNPVNNLRFRQALSQAIDRNSILTIMLNNHGLLPTAYSIESDTTQPSPLLFSIASAKQWAQPFSKQTVKLLIPSDSVVTQNIAQRIQLSARMVGLIMTIQESPYPEFYQAIQNGNYDLFYGSYSPELENPDWMLRELFVEPNRGYSGNASQFYSSEFNSLLNQYAMETSDTLREQLVGKMNELLFEFMPLIPLYNVDPMILHQPNVYDTSASGIERSGFPDTYNSVWMKEE